MSKFTHVILCGGSGTRLWPLSNSKQPKQLIQIFKGKSLLQLSAERNLPFANNIIAVSSQKQTEDVVSQLRQSIGGMTLNIIAEPIGRNTAAAIALAALTVAPEDLLLITPADQLIGTPALYESAITMAIELANQNNLVTFGLKPLAPETGYGYIQYKNDDVVRFTEKPDVEVANSFIASGDYLWNSGIFCFKASTILEELKLYAPDVLSLSLVAMEEWKEKGEITLPTMLAIPSISIDYAIMEKSAKVKVVKTEMEWSDVGSYEALSEALINQYDHKNNLAVSIKNEGVNTVIGEDKLVAFVGVSDLIVVNTPTSILILKKGEGQEIKNLHNWVKENNPELL